MVPYGIDLLGAEVLPVALIDAAGKHLGRPFVIRLEKILAQGMVGVSFPHQDARQLGVAREAHAHHVVDLALLEISPAVNVIERGNFADPIRFGGAHPQLDQLAGLFDRIELVIDFNAVLEMHALQAGQIVVLDRVLVAQIKRDVDQLFSRDEQGRLNDADRPLPERGVDARCQLREPGISQPDEGRPGFGPLGFLAAGGLGRGRGGSRRCGFVPGCGFDGLAPSLGADHLDLAHRLGCRGRLSWRGFGGSRFRLGLWRRDLGRLLNQGLAGVDQPLGGLLRGDLDGTQVDQVRPEHRDRNITLDFVAVPGREALFVQQRDVQFLAVDLPLKDDQSVQKRLRRGRAARNVYVDRDVLIDARDHVVAFLERPAAGGAGTHRHHVFRLGHLVVEPRDHGHHRLGDRAGDDHQISLPRRAPEDLGPESCDVEPARSGADHLDRTASQAEAQRPEGRPAPPVVDRVDDPEQLVPLGDKDMLLQFSLEDRVDHRAPFGAGDCRVRHGVCGLYLEGRRVPSRRGNSGDSLAAPTSET